MNIKGIMLAIAAICAITLIMGAALGAVYNITKKPIQDAEEKAKQEAYTEVFPSASEIVTLTDEDINMDNVNAVIANKGFEDSRIDEISIAADEDGMAAGFIILVTNSAGYGGDIQMAVGVSVDGSIQGISFLSISETAGLGMEAQNEEFLSQFIGKQVGQFTYTKTGSTSDSEIDAISGATITTSAVVDAVNAVMCFIGGLY
ncbi:MAG: RnfABCDGE type electron transport complex subunit G [Wujia sp.]